MKSWLPTLIMLEAALFVFTVWALNNGLAGWLFLAYLAQTGRIFLIFFATQTLRKVSQRLVVQVSDINKTAAAQNIIIDTYKKRIDELEEQTDMCWCRDKK